MAKPCCKQEMWSYGSKNSKSRNKIKRAAHKAVRRVGKESRYE